MSLDDAIVVSAGKLMKQWDFASELRSSLCERRLERTVLRLALLPVKTAQFTHDLLKREEVSVVDRIRHEQLICTAQLYC